MPCSRRARSTGHRCHHMQPTDPWRARGVGTDPCPNHVQPLRRNLHHEHAARAAGRSLASARPQRVPTGPADRDRQIATGRPTSARTRGAHRHGEQRSTRPHRAGELSTVPRTAELEQHWPASGGRQPLLHTPRVGWQGQQRSGGGLRMEGGSMGGLPGVDASSRPCTPLDLPRSPAGRAGS